MVRNEGKKTPVAPPATPPVAPWRFRILAALLLSGPLLLPTQAAEAGVVEGKLNGLRCATDGTACPVDKQDPVIGSESDFVVQQADGSFFYVHNIERRVKARHALDTVRVTGDVDLKYRSVRAVKMEVLEQGTYRRVWTPKRTSDDLRMPGASRR